VSLTIDFGESYHGVSKTIQYSRNMFDDNATKKDCQTCGGRGVVSQQARTPFGVMQTQAACTDCGGLGQRYEKDGKILTGG
jgi:molecular chaperone DnaJ